MTARRAFLLGWLLLTGGCMDEISRGKTLLTAPPVTRFTGTYTAILWPESTTVPVGGTTQLGWQIQLDAAARAVTATVSGSFTSQDNSIAVVNGGGQVTGRAPGTTMVTLAPVILAGKAPLDEVVQVVDTAFITVVPE